MSRFRILITLLTQTILKIEGQCPSPCVCPSSYVADCASNELSELPNARFDLYLEELDISDNRLSSLDRLSLRNMKVISLVELNASTNFISSIHEEAFVGQSSLKTVDLSSNKLATLSPKLLFYNPFLEWLSLSKNQHIKLPEFGPFLNSPSLKILHLSFCNINNIPEDNFMQLPNLQELYLDHNRIENLHPLYGAENLKILDLSHNHLSNLDSKLFPSSGHLIQLNLSYNWLYTISHDVIPKLSKVSRSGDLAGNPWLCDCLMFNKTYSWCIDNGVKLDLICTSPPLFEGKSWTAYGHVHCYDIDNDANMDAVDLFGGNLGQLGLQRRANLEMRMGSTITQLYQDEETEFIVNYLYTTILFGTLCAFLLVVAGFMWYRLTSRPSFRYGPSLNEAERGNLKSQNT